MEENIPPQTVSARQIRLLWKIVPTLLLLLALELTSHHPPVKAQAGQDLRFILQTQGGLTAYTELPAPVSLLHARQLLGAIEVENDEFVYGDYILAGETYSVKLAIGAAGWIIAFHPPDYGSQRLLDCPANFDATHIIGRPERAIEEAAAALQYADPLIGFYDNRFPEATGVTIHWLYKAQSGTSTSTLTLPLENLYLERGYAFCTALTNSEFYLNDEMLERVGGVTGVVRRWNSLGPHQLRAGQTNSLEIKSLSLFGTGFLAGVSTVYTGNAPLIAEGGYTRNLALAYPPMLGEPLPISRVLLPTVFR